MGLEKMNLVGHSLGGYISTKYAAKYPQYVEKILLLSPMGVEECKNEAGESYIHPDINNHFVKRNMFKLARCMIKNNRSPFDLMRFIGRFTAPFFIQDSVKRKFKSVPEEDFDKLYSYLYQVTMAQGSGEYAMGRLVETSLSAFDPIFYDLQAMKDKDLPIMIAYGDGDYVNTSFNDDPISETLSKEGFDVHIVPDSSHQVYLDNPDFCVELIQKAIGNKS